MLCFCVLCMCFCLPPTRKKIKCYRALGNLGNALLAQGELKKALLAELQLAVAQDGSGIGREGRVSIEGAEARLRWVGSRV